MKKILFVFVVFILNLNISFGQERELPNINVKTLSGKKFNISNLQNNGNPIVISFWDNFANLVKS